MTPLKAKFQFIPTFNNQLLLHPVEKGKNKKSLLLFMMNIKAVTLFKKERSCISRFTSCNKTKTTFSLYAILKC